MSKRTQIMASAGLVVAAVAVVTVYTVNTRPGEVAVSAGHDHSAMAAAGGERAAVNLDAESARRIGVTYATAAMKPIRRTVNTVGNVTYDETRLSNVNPKIEGWVEHLYVDFTGAPVRAGQPLLSIYSPMLVSAQEELLLARRLVENTNADETTRSSTNARALLDAARRRLRYWDIPEEAIARIEASGEPERTLTLLAPASGVVVEKSVVEGARVMPGMDLYRIADLTRVWVEGEVFEKDLSLIRTGQRASVTFEAYPGETFEGAVTYVYPTVSPESRTGRVRVELANPALRLKPGMYARLVLMADEGLSGLMIPRSAVHYTGERALIFVREPDGTLRPREITTGLLAGDDVEVLAGLAVGEVVVNSASFLIDAESNMGATMRTMPGMETTSPDSAPMDEHADHATPTGTAAQPGRSAARNAGGRGRD